MKRICLLSSSHLENFTRWLRKVFCPKVGDSHKYAENEAVEFEDAIAATGFGKFNILLMLYAIPAAMSCMFDTTTMSYVMTSAECDLQLSLMNKGVLNAITHSGMITSAFFYGYLTDTLGRRNVLIYGCLLDAICNMLTAFSQNFIMLVILKFFTGILISGPCTVLVTCLSEFFSSPVRPMFSMYIGLCFSIGNVTLPFVAWAILARPYDRWIGPFAIHSWQVFIAVCAIPSLCTGLFGTMLPESPRFLLSRGRKEEALAILKKVYAINNNCSPDTYPVKELKYVVSHQIKKDVESNNDGIKEITEKETALSAIRGGLKQMRPLFVPPYLSIVFLIIVLEFGCMTGCNTLRLWLPQLFKMMSESDENHNTLCEMISINKTVGVSQVHIPETGICEPININPQTFISPATVSGIQVIFCALSSFVINAMGNKKLLFMLFSVGGACSLTLYWCTDTLQATMLAAIAVSFNAISSNTIMSVIVDLFPTSLKAMITSLALMVGRIGSITGNILFPLLLSMGCLMPFLTLGCMLLACSLLTIAIPKPKKENYKALNSKQSNRINGEQKISS